MFSLFRGGVHGGYWVRGGGGLLVVLQEQKMICPARRLRWGMGI